MHNPPAGEHDALLPVNCIKAHPAACQTIESRVEWMPEPPELWQICERCSVNRLRAFHMMRPLYHQKPREVSQWRVIAVARDEWRTRRDSNPKPSDP
jgi:hypothetical protein